MVTHFTCQHTISLTSYNSFTSPTVSFDNVVLDAILATPINLLLILNGYGVCGLQNASVVR